MVNKYLFYISFFLILAYGYIFLAKKVGIIDRPNNRSAHTKITTRGLGILFYFSVFVFGVNSEYNYPFFLSGILILGFISFLDDLLTLRSYIRLPFQLIGVLLIIIQLKLSFGLGESFLAIGVITFFGLGFLNAFNFMDGINGITGLYSLVSIISFWWVDRDDHLLDHSLFLYVSTAILVFLYFNLRKKAIAFSGDVGSITIAGVLFFIGFALSGYIGWKYLLFFSIYGLDTAYTLIYRIIKKENILQAHKLHFYQLLIHEKGMSHLFVSGVYAALQLLININVIYTSSLILIFIPIALISFFMHYYRFTLNKGIRLLPNNKM